MNINNLFMMAHNAEIKDLIPLKDIDEVLSFLKMEGPDNFTYQDAIEKYGQKIADNIYLYNQGMPDMIYFDKNTYVLFEVFGPILLSNISKEKLEFLIESLEKDIQQYGLESSEVSWKISSKFRTSLISYYLENNTIKNYEEFIRFYTESEYGFQSFSIEKIEDIFSQFTERLGQEYLKTLPEKITVYRGVGDKSTDLDKTISWTLDKNTAYFFAYKNSDKTSGIYTATVNKSDILDYIDLRDEAEVLILPKHIQSPIYHSLYSYEDLKDWYFDDISKVLRKVQQISRKISKLYQKHSLKFDKYSEHSPNHMMRVAVLAGLLHEFLKDDYEVLDDESFECVVVAGLLHDIGRQNEWEDEDHGVRSAEIGKKYLSKNGKIIVSYHNKEDKTFYEWVEKRHFKDNIEKERLILCYKILKDADALDRVRFTRGLDVNYLRFEDSKDFIFFAHQMLSMKFE